MVKGIGIDSVDIEEMARLCSATDAAGQFLAEFRPVVSP